MPPSSRKGQFARLSACYRKGRTGYTHGLRQTFFSFAKFSAPPRHDLVVSDFYEDPEVVVKTMEPMRFHGNEIVLFHVLDPQEIRPKFKDPALVSIWKQATRSKSHPIREARVRREDRRPFAGLKDARSVRHRLFPDDTSEPLTRGCELPASETGEELVSGFSLSMVSGGRSRWAFRFSCTCCGSTSRIRCRSAH